MPDSSQSERVQRPCPCGGGGDYASCCLPYIRGDCQPKTAAALMRSRYSAYAMGEASYLVATHHPRTADRALAQKIKAWMAETHWLGLEILETSGGQPDDAKGNVAFRATFSSGGKIAAHWERSRFERHKGQWRYVDGKFE